MLSYKQIGPHSTQGRTSFSRICKVENSVFNANNFIYNNKV